MIELGGIHSGRAQCVAGNLTGGVGRRADPEGRLERLRDCAFGRICWQLGQPTDECSRDSVSRCVESCEIRSSIATFESLRARAEHGGRRRHRLRVLRAGELERWQLVRRREEGEEPVQLVRKRSERGRRSGRTRRAVLGAEKALPQSIDRFAREARAFGRLLRLGVQTRCHRTQRARGFAPQVGASTWRPQQHDRARTDANREAPAFEAVRDRRVRRRNRHRQHEREERSGCGRREVAADHAREERDEADGRHRARAEPRAS